MIILGNCDSSRLTVDPSMWCGHKTLENIEIKFILVASTSASLLKRLILMKLVKAPPFTIFMEILNSRIQSDIAWLLNNTY